MGDSQQAAIRVLLVDDEPKLRTAWAALLGGQPDMVCVGTLDRADRVQATAEAEAADVVLMDLTMPGADPLEVVRAMNASGCPAKVVFYTGRQGDGLVDRLMDAGAWGMVDKLCTPTEILSALRRVARGETAFAE